MCSDRCQFSSFDYFFTSLSLTCSPFSCLGLNNLAILLMSFLRSFAGQIIRSIEPDFHVSEHVDHFIDIISNFKQSIIILHKSLLDFQCFFLNVLLCSIFKELRCLLLCLKSKPAALARILELRLNLCIFKLSLDLLRLIFFISIRSQIFQMLLQFFSTKLRSRSTRFPLWIFRSNVLNVFNLFHSTLIIMIKHENKRL